MKNLRTTIFTELNAKKVIFWLSILHISSINAQTATTFTCSKANVSDSLISGGVLSAQDGSFGEDLKVQGNLNLSGNFLFDTANPIGIEASTSSLSPYGGLTFAPSSGSIVAKPAFPNPCISVIPLPQYSFGGRIQAFDNANNLSLDMGSDNVNNFIDSRGYGPTNSSGHLLINYYCGKDILLGTNSNFPTKVFTGGHVEMRKHAQIGTSSVPITDASNTAFQIFANAGNGITLHTTNSNLVAINLSNSIGNMFTLLGDGRLYVGEKKIQPTHLHANSQFQFWGKLACKELVVVDPTKWSDFVFDENYKLLPLMELENYYKLNKHLPNVPTEEEVMKNGINVADMYAILLQKIEEQTLYNVELNKQIEKLKTEINELKRNK